MIKIIFQQKIEIARSQKKTLRATNSENSILGYKEESDDQEEGFENLKNLKVRSTELGYQTVIQSSKKSRYKEKRYKTEYINKSKKPL